MESHTKVTRDALERFLNHAENTASPREKALIYLFLCGLNNEQVESVKQNNLIAGRYLKLVGFEKLLPKKVGDFLCKSFKSHKLSYLKTATTNTIVRHLGKDVGVDITMEDLRKPESVSWFYEICSNKVKDEHQRQKTAKAELSSTELLEYIRRCQ